MVVKSKIYKKISNYLMDQIERGEVKLGEAIYSENQLCRMFNASKTSVRRAIREMVERNVLESRQGVGTFVCSSTPPKTICLLNHSSRQLRYNTIDSYYASFIYETEKRATELKHRFQIFSGPIANPLEISKKTAHLNADAIILDGAYQDYFKDVSAFRKIFPASIVLDGVPDEITMPSVSPDLEPAFFELLSQAMGRGGSILFLYNGNIGRRRWSKSCFERAAIRLKLNNVIFCDYTENITEDLLLGINQLCLIFRTLNELFLKTDIRTIFCGSDRSALGVCSWLREQHYRIPEDIAVVGMGGIEFSAFCEPPLTTIKIPTLSMASTAVDLVAKQLQGGLIPDCTLLPVKILKRDSL